MFKPVLLSAAHTSTPAPTPGDSTTAAAATPGRSGSLWTRIGTFPAVICSLIILKPFLFSMPGVGDPDIFWHLRDGQFMVSLHQFPAVDHFSFTCAGQPWLSHEWVSELIYYGAYRSLHWRGVLLVSEIVPALITIGMFLLAWKRTKDPFAAGLATMAGTALMAVGDGPRMHHFGWLCFVAVLGILQSFRLQRNGPLWAIPILFCAWINLHGSWPFGFVAFGLVFLSGLIQRDIGRLKASPWSGRDIAKLLATGLASGAAIFVNPFGYKLVYYPVDLILHQRFATSIVQEWLPLTFGKTTGFWVGVILAVILTSTAMHEIPWRIDDLALTLFVFYAAFSHERLLLPAGIVLATVLAPLLVGMSSYDPHRERTILNISLMGGVMLAMIGLFPKDAKLQHNIDSKYPAGAVEYLRMHPGHLRLFHDYDWGGYIGWTLPEQKVFLDPRSDIFERTGVLQDYFDASTLKRTDEIMQKYDFDSALIAKELPMARWLGLQPDKWRLTYSDTVSVIYERIPVTHPR